jgi:hypothetical protein
MQEQPQSVDFNTTWHIINSKFQISLRKLFSNILPILCNLKSNLLYTHSVFNFAWELTENREVTELLRQSVTVRKHHTEQSGAVQHVCSQTVPLKQFSLSLKLNEIFSPWTNISLHKTPTTHITSLRHQYFSPQNFHKTHDIFTSPIFRSTKLPQLTSHLYVTNISLHISPTTHMTSLRHQYFSSQNSHNSNDIFKSPIFLSTKLPLLT